MNSNSHIISRDCLYL